MAVLPAARVFALLVALVAVLALGAGCGSDADDPDPAPSPTATTATTEPSAAAPTDDQFCALFVQFAGDQSQHAGAQTPETTEALIRSGLTLASLPPTGDMSQAVHASLVNLVAETLDGIVAAADLPVVEGTPDEAAFSAYLNQACPA